ncbi:MAG: formate dehydrogenase accessory sulfurtransferase FdhD [Actinobacteria bacterium]|nr:formate dehydrogenase accessory sulfurtransferase FdhD [Actinomycetota bacterium]
MSQKQSNKLSREIKIKKVKASSGFEEMLDRIPAELMLTIILNGRKLSTISCSPESPIDITVGYLINNGYINSYSDISLLKICHQKINGIISKNDVFINVEVEAAIVADNIEFKQNFISSACGNIDDFIFDIGLSKIKSQLKIMAEHILRLNKQNSETQQHKKESGGLHSASLFNSMGDLVLTAEDIGRHNCIDKIAGRISIMKIDVSDKMIYTTGRLSIDAVYKIIKMKIPVVVTNSSVTYSAVLFAKKLNLTAIGYARGGRFNIYSHPERIIYKTG